MQWKVIDVATQKGKGEMEPDFAAPNRRSEPRFTLTFPIEVSGFERCGKYFIERTSCSDVGELSCAFVLCADVACDGVVAIRCFHWQNSSVLESKPVLFQIVRLETRQGVQNAAEPHAQLVAAVRLHARIGP
jgi:hypothetical protein